MWWVFERKLETPDKIVYMYARKSDNLDGIIEYDKSSEESIMVRPCEADKDREWSQEKTIGNFISFVVGEQFPQRRKVVIG